MSAHPTRSPSVVSGPPLGSEPGLGALTLPGFLRTMTREYADREALVLHEPGGVTRWTYAELWEQASAVAGALTARGLDKDGRVGVLMTNRPEWLAAVFGTSLAGGVAVPLSTFSTPSELDHLLRASAVAHLLVEREIAGRDLAAVLTDLGLHGYPFLRSVVMVGEASQGFESWQSFTETGAGEPAALIEARAGTTNPSDPAAIFFSSGSTSRPKGIVNSHRGIGVQLWRFRRMYGFGPDDVVRCWTANGFFWSGNFGMALGATLAAGGTLVLQRTFDAAEALRLLQAEQVTFPVAWPHQWAQLEGADGWAAADLSAMRFADKGTPIGRHPTVRSEYDEPGHAYGNTETFTISTAFASGTPDDVTAGSSGEPLPGNTVKIVDPVTGDVVPRGEAGEICVKGPTLMLGYLGTPLDETLDAEGFFATGDGGHLDDAGRLFWHGRLTDIIKTGGANVSPLEVDEALAACHGVAVARTVGVPHETLGELVVACVALHAGIEPDAARITGFLRERLAAYKVPREIVFLDEKDFTLTGSAKVRAGELRELATKRLTERAEAAREANATATASTGTAADENTDSAAGAAGTVAPA